MIRHVALALLAAAGPLLAAGDSTVRFVNGDHLTGTVDELTRDKLVWKSDLLAGPTPFHLDGVLDVTLPATTPDSEARHEATVSLTNGDTVRGQLAAVSDATVELDTWFAGRLKLNRLMVSDIRIDERPDLIFRGPKGLDGWTQSGGKPAWTYQNGAFLSTAQGGIARDLPLPAEVRIAFDVAWRNSFSFKLMFFTDDVTTDRPEVGYDMTFMNRNISLRGCATERYVGNSSNATAFQENEKARIEVHASRKTGKVSVHVDDHIIDVWTDPEFARNAAGGGLHFVSGTNSPVRVSRIEVQTWDGEEEQVPEPQFGRGFPRFGLQDGSEEEVPEEKPALEDGRMELRNGDTMAGEVLSIEGGKFLIKTPFNEIRLPIEALRSLALKPVPLERCKRMNGDIRAWFPDGSSLVFRLDAVGDGTLTGYSQNFGTAEFRTEAFNRIEFNIYTPELEEVRMADGW